MLFVSHSRRATSLAELMTVGKERFSSGDHDLKHRFYAPIREVAQAAFNNDVILHELVCCDSIRDVHECEEAKDYSEHG